MFLKCSYSCGLNAARAPQLKASVGRPTEYSGITKRTEGVNRMKRTVLILLLCSLPTVVPAQRNDRRGKELLRLEDQWREAQQRNDRATFDRLLSPDLTFVGTSGSFRNKTEFMASRGNSWIPRAESYTYADLAVRFYGEAAIVTGLEATRGPGVTAQARFTHVWSKVHRKWRLVAIQRTEIMPNP